MTQGEMMVWAATFSRAVYARTLDDECEQEVLLMAVEWACSNVKRMSKALDVTEAEFAPGSDERQMLLEMLAPTPPTEEKG